MAGIYRPPAAPPDVTSDRHELRRRFAEMRAGRGKFENLNDVVDAEADWLVLIDDDVVLPQRFLDRFVAVCEKLRLDLAQPAQTLASHAAWRVVRRRPLVARTRDALRRDRPRHGVQPARSGGAAALPRAPLRLGPRPALGGDRGRARLARRDRRRAARQARGGARRRGLPGRRRDRGGAALPRRPALPPERRGARRAGGAPVRVCVVAEYYPSEHSPVSGVWAHRQALAARDAGADVRVIVLDRRVPPAAALRDPDRLTRELRSALTRPRHATLDGIEVGVRPVRVAAARARVLAVAPLGAPPAPPRARPPWSVRPRARALRAPRRRGGAGLDRAAPHPAVRLRPRRRRAGAHARRARRPCHGRPRAARGRRRALQQPCHAAAVGRAGRHERAHACGAPRHRRPRPAAARGTPSRPWPPSGT